MTKLRNLFIKFADINSRYRQPRIEMSGAVRFSLLVLRLYLLSLVALMIYKFVLIVTRG
ncbi:MAG TPA: hypothetical protein VKP66_20820 [Steroidobacteraceae bacterium]|nr:hypothetical protein [Steroidobacteraceae bacterium]